MEDYIKQACNLDYMENTKLILDKLDSIKEELDYIKSHVVDLDVVLTRDDLEALKEAEEDFKRGKTKRLAWVYSVHASERAKKFLDKLDEHLRLRIEGKTQKFK